MPLKEKLSQISVLPIDNVIMHEVGEFSSEAATRVFYKKDVIPVTESFLIKFRSEAQVLSCVFCKIFKIIFFTEQKLF